MQSITREIQIDAAHRVPDHGSKCRFIHGHRYVVQATCVGPLHDSGEQTGMVIDFGFLKEEMMAVIDGPADHGLLLYHKDPLAVVLLESPELFQGAFGKVMFLPSVPTAENLAKYWYDQLQLRVNTRTDGHVRLLRVRVYETPNCWADYC